MMKFADLIDEHAEELAALDTIDAGKLFGEGKAGVPHSANMLRYYAGAADKIHGEVLKMSREFHAYTLREPIGVVGHIIPWNFPTSMFLGKVSPALAAGCTMVVKPAEQTPLSALYYAHLSKLAGIPDGVLNVVTGFGPTAGAAISSHMDIDAVSFTGSTEVGREVMQAAAKSNLKTLSLELGGKSPLTIFDDADINKAAELALLGILYNKGEICVASSHVFVQEGIYDEFVKNLLEKKINWTVGDPFDPKVRQGPQEDMLIAKDEIVGPVMSLMKFKTRMVVGVGSKNIAGSFLEVIEKQGWQGLWAGNAINMVRIIPTQAIELGTFECVKRSMTSAQEKWNQEECPRLQIGRFSLKFTPSWISPIAVAGAAAGIVSTLACHPLEVLKDRLTVSPEAYPSLSVAISKIYKDGGIGAFYAGISPTLIGMLPYSTCYYFMYETLKTSYCQSKNKKSLNRPEMLLLGAFAGFTASTISFPLEVARKRLMVGALQGKCPPHMAAALSEVIRERGLLGLYRGWGASCLKVMPSSGITWMFYEAWKDILLVGRGHL